MFFFIFPAIPSLHELRLRCYGLPIYYLYICMNDDRSSLVFSGPPRRGGSVPKRFEAINYQTHCHVGPRDEKEGSVTRIHKNSKPANSGV